MNPSSLKIKLRKKYKKKRSLLPFAELKKKSLLLNKKLLRSKEYKTSQTVFCYISFNREIDTFLILNECINDNKTLCVPVIKNNKMIACRITSLLNLKKNKYGILEPQKIHEIKKQDIDLCIVPGLVFNNLGYRIGYGKGFYDLFLNNYKGISVSLVLKKFICNKFIPEEFDLPINNLFIQ